MAVEWDYQLLSGWGAEIYLEDGNVIVVKVNNRTGIVEVTWSGVPPRGGETSRSDSQEC